MPSALRIASPRLISALDGLYTGLFGTLGGGPLFGLIRFALCFLVLLVPTTLMGGTLPLLVRHVTEDAARLGRRGRGQRGKSSAVGGDTFSIAFDGGLVGPLPPENLRPQGCSDTSPTKKLCAVRGCNIRHMWYNR